MEIVNHCEQLINIDSPSGFINQIQAYLIAFANEHQLDYELTNKGNVIIYARVNGQEPKTLVATHVDTLGLMVRSIEDDGTVNVTPIGGPVASTLNGEYATLYTRENKQISGTVLLKSDAKHVYADANKTVEFSDLRFRIDQNVTSKEQVLKLGINNGDFICYDPKFRVSGDYINSRFLDDKLCAAISMQILQEFSQGKIELQKSVAFAFTCYEEVGHGLSHLKPSIEHVIALDMGCVGDDLEGAEHKVSICVKDSSGPYDYDTITKMQAICEQLSLPYALDVYPFYGSDASAALRGGNDIKASLIGPGIAASHGMERGHRDGVMATYKLLTQMLID